MGAREAIVPSEFVFVPHHPKQAQNKSSCGKHVARAATKHLPVRGRFAGKADDLQASHHHARGCSAEGREEGEYCRYTMANVVAYTAAFSLLSVNSPPSEPKSIRNPPYANNKQPKSISAAKRRSSIDATG